MTSETESLTSQQLRLRRHNDQQHSRTVRTWDWVVQLTHCLHSLFVLGAGSYSIFSEIRHFHHWTQWLTSPTSSSQRFLFMIMASFYLWDCLIVLIRGQHLFLKLTHHLVCALGLLSCVIFGRDGSLVVVAGVVAEVVNPCRFLFLYITAKRKVQLDGNSNKSRFWDSGSLHVLWQFGTQSEWSVFLVFLPFLCTRVVLLQYVANVILSYSKLYSTKLCALILVGLSILSILRYILRHRKLDTLL